MSSQPIAIPAAAPRAYAVEGLVDIHSTPLTHSQRSSILPSRKLYVPVHKRSSSASSASSVSSSVSSRASSTFSSAESSSSRSDSSCATSPALSVSSLEADEHEKEVAAAAADATAATGIASSTTSSSSSPTTPTRTLPPFVYSPSELLALATSTHSRIAPSTRDALRANVPEIVMNRQQRKSIAFKAAHGGPSAVPVTIVSKHYQFGHANGNTNGGAGGKRAGGNGGARSRSTHSRSSSESCCSSAQSDCSCWRSSPQ